MVTAIEVKLSVVGVPGTDDAARLVDVSPNDIGKALGWPDLLDDSKPSVGIALDETAGLGSLGLVSVVWLEPLEEGELCGGFALDVGGGFVRVVVTGGAGFWFVVVGEGGRGLAVGTDVDGPGDGGRPGALFPGLDGSPLSSPFLSLHLGSTQRPKPLHHASKRVSCRCLTASR